MPEYAPLSIPADGKLAHNITHFARALRKAGLPVGPGHVVGAVQAVTAVGFVNRTDFFHTLRACFISRPEHRVVYAQIFRLFWRDPRYLEHMMAMLLPAIRGVAPERVPQAAERRAAEALTDGADHAPPEVPSSDETEFEIDARLTASSEERLRQLDFEQMSSAEMAEARRLIARLKLPAPAIIARRARRSVLGRRPDWRATMREAMRRGGELQRPVFRARATRWPDLVAICDISGSMSAYSRAMLHFLHTLANQPGAGWARVHSFTFGTRLTNITRHLAARDVDAALAAAGAQAQDWEGGTRIGDCLHAFNRDWSRRVLGSGGVVLLITDGLERAAPERLAREMERLHLSARRLIWVNPLLRWDGFAPKAQGVRAMLAHVDCFRAGHNIASLAALAEAVAGAGGEGEKLRLMQALAR